MFPARDTETEDVLFRDTDNFNKHVEEVQAWNIKKAKLIITDEFCERLAGIVPGMTNANRRDNVIKWLRANPAMKTLNQEVLYQRILCQYNHYGDISRAVRPTKPHPMQNIYNRNLKRERMMGLAQQIQQQNQELNQEYE